MVLAGRIHDRAQAVSIAAVDPFWIDRINIYQASRLAMREAVLGLSVAPDFLYVDALKLDLDLPQEALIRGDARCASIAAASIVAKVARDACLRRWQEIYPEFNLASNKGYCAPDHFLGLDTHGPTPQHRFSFEPVRVSAGWGQRSLF